MIRKASVIIPAYNEAATIKNVIHAALNCSLVNEVIVINDGSQDDTKRVVSNTGAFLIDFNKNKGKAEAMSAGVSRAKNDVICFLDADLYNITKDHIAQLLLPVLENKFDMNIGIISRKHIIINRLIHFFPLIGGERALTKSFWQKIPKKYKRKFEIEISLNYHSGKYAKKTNSFFLSGVNQIVKEKKHGLITGFIERIKMVKDILFISFKLYFLDQSASKLKKFSRKINSFLILNR